MYFSVKAAGRTLVKPIGNDLNLHQRRFRLDIKKKYLLRKSREVSEQSAQGGGGDDIPERVHIMWRCSTEGHG